MKIRVGTSGYNYPEWRGTFYPEKFPPSRMLAYYAERFGTVEINATFYRMPTEKTLGGWAAETPDGFVFALKAPQRITHMARLRNIGDPLDYFCRTARTLGSKLGPLLFQLPPNFKKDLPRLDGLLRQVPADLPVALEFRHESWFAHDVYERLRAHPAALCIADTEEGTTPEVPTGAFGYLRLRGVAYADEDLRGWAARIRNLGQGWNEAFVFFKHEESGTGPALGKRFETILAG